MTRSTRRRVIVAAIILALTAPIETILLKAVSTTDSAQAVHDWVADLSDAELAEAAGAIQDYPFAYRRAIMARLTPDDRARTWRRHIDLYVSSHPDLDATALPVLDAAAALATPGMFDVPTPDDLATLDAVANQLVAVVGREAAEEVLYRLGPKDGTFASLEPWSERLANYVRSVAVVMARWADDCDCSTSFGCPSGGRCDGASGCAPVEPWPACGWFWDETCDGTCSVAAY